MKALIFDSGTLINLSMNGLLYLLKELKKTFQGKFIITRQVKKEVVDRPSNVKRFELGALRIQALIDSKVLEFPSSLNISDSDVEKRTKTLMDKANHLMKAKNQWIKIVSDAEMSCLAISSICTEKKIESLISIDERTTRILAEKPQDLEKIISRKLHQKVNLKGEGIKAFKEFRFIRSTELVYVAFKKNLLRVKGKKALDAVLYATRFKGSSVSFEEIEALKKL